MGRNKKEKVKTHGHRVVAQQLQDELDKTIKGFCDIESRVLSIRDGRAYRDYKYELCNLILNTFYSKTKKHKADDKYVSFHYKELKTKLGRDYRKIMDTCFIYKKAGGGYKQIRDSATYKYKLKSDVIDTINKHLGKSFSRQDYIKDGVIMKAHNLPKYSVREKKSGKWVNVIKSKAFSNLVSLNGDNIKLVLSVYSDLQKYYKDGNTKVYIKDALRLLKEYGWDIEEYNNNTKRINGAIERRLKDTINLIQLTHNNAYNTDDIIQTYTIKDSGRFYIEQDKNDTDTNLQNLPREIRKIVMGGMGYYEYDIENAHYNILSQLYTNISGKKLNSIDYYTNNTKEIREQISAELKVSYRFAKDLLLMMIYGANIFAKHRSNIITHKLETSDTARKVLEYTNDDKMHADEIHNLIEINDTLGKIHKEIKTGRKLILSKAKRVNVRGVEKIYNHLSRGTNIYKKYNKKNIEKTQGSLLSHIIQGLESHILVSVRGEDDGMIMFHHDGWVSRNDMDTQLLEQIIERRMKELLISNNIDGTMQFSVVKEKLADVNKSSEILKRISLGSKISIQV